MSSPIVILGERGSAFSPRLAEAIASRGTGCAARSLDAVFEGAVVTVSESRVVWEGVDLAMAGAVFLERPIFSWPQPASAAELPDGAERRARDAAREREARSLTISAVMAAASSCPIANSPASGALAASRAIALVELQAAGLPVRAWSLVTTPPAGAGENALLFDLIGRERWHEPAAPSAGDPCLRIDPPGGEIFGLLVVGGRVAGARRYTSASAWAAERGAEPAPAGRLSAPQTDLGVRAAAALGLEVAEVWVGGEAGAPVTLLVEAGPDLQKWDAALQGGAAALIADRLIDIARTGKGGGS